MLRKNKGRISIAVALSLAACACTCTDTEQYTSTSPKGTRSVFVSVRNCGATTGLITIVGERQGWFGRRVDLLVIDGEAVGEKLLTINWFDEGEIVVHVDSSLSVRPVAPFPSDLKVGYEPGTRLGR